MNNRDQSIIAMHIEGKTANEIADFFHISARSVRRIIQNELGGSTKVANSWLVIADLHMPFLDKDCMGKIIDYAKDERIENLMILGDGFDFYEISKWGDKFRMPFEEEIAASEQMLHECVLSRLNFKRKIFIEGNHEERLTRYISLNARKIQKLLDAKGFDIPKITGLESAGFEYINNKQLRCDTGKFFKIGHLNFLHGHELQNGGKYPARNLIMKCHDNVLVAHNHKPDVAYEFDLDGTPRAVNSIGCCCGMYPEYQTFNEWRQGFGIVKFRDNGLHTVQNKVIAKGEVY